MISNKISTQEPKIKNKGIVRASYAKSMVAAPFTALSTAGVYTMRRLSQTSKEDTITIKKAISKALTDTGLREKGTKAVFVDTLKNKKEIQGFVTNLFSADKLPKAEEKAIKAISKEVDHLKNKKVFKPLLEKLQGNLADNPEFNKICERGVSLANLLQVKMGANAFYLPHGNAMIVPDGKLTTSAFHEMGHALNANFSKIGKFIQNNRKLATSMAGAIALIGICTKKKADDETPNKGIGKVTHFIKKNAGILSLASMAPVVAEEAMATIKGNKIASKMLDKNLLKKVKLSNALGLSTYVLSAVSVAFSTVIAIKVKDALQARHEEKLAAKQK